ncbi:hypothetical protein [Spirosoma montaniterrae]|uniref:NADH dehydrogenase n=1 Tax=Spirosoma montaniterrae TaxID=1178516 RepID=A0A1P9WTU4_9BACT|nr:hypothetical protein [Spirosoma montaniterrae]AQG78797.1 hypothetical protein AWR27_05325 [Spirosoma montaniterrae]
MFGLDPFSRPVAIAEILLLLAFAAFVGWLLARLIWAGRISALRSAIADKESELEECRRSKVAAPTVVAPVSSPAITPAPEPVATFVHADPLEPALSFDTTPNLMDEVPPAAPAIPEPPVVMPPASSTVAGNSEAAVLSRIAARADELNFDRIGRATAADADDLKDIVGVGPFLERKLHSLGIYTFRQVANFTKEDIDKVNEIIEFFPGRIERDNWVEQSRAFYDRKYGNKA